MLQKWYYFKNKIYEEIKMKKSIFKRIVVVLMLVVLTLSCVACSKNKLDGTWTCEAGGIVAATLEIKGDKLTMTSLTGEELEIKCKIKGDKLILSSPNGEEGTFEASISKGNKEIKFPAELAGIELVFKKK